MKRKTDLKTVKVNLMLYLNFASNVLHKAPEDCLYKVTATTNAFLGTDILLVRTKKAPYVGAIYVAYGHYLFVSYHNKKKAWYCEIEPLKNKTFDDILKARHISKLNPNGGHLCSLSQYYSII